MPEDQIKIENKSSSSRKFNLRRAAIVGIIAVVAIYGISLILLNTSWVKRKLTSKLQQKTNIDWYLGSATWIPFGDIVLSDLTSTMGEGGIKIESLHVTPSWSHLFSGSLKFDEVEIGEAALDIDIQWIKDQSSKDSPSIRKTPVKPKKTQPKVSKPLKPKLAKPNPAAPKAKPVKDVAAQPVEKEVKLDTRPNQWLNIKDLKIIVRDGTKVIDSVNNISVRLPYFGKPNEGSVKFNFQGESFTQSVHWDGNSLTAENTQGGVFGLKYQWKMRSKLARGLPFSIVFQLPEQSLNYSLNRPNFHLGVSSKTIDANLVMSGGLKNIKTWRAIFNINSSDFIISENQKTHKKMHFDTVRLAGNLENGRLKMPYAEALGHKTSILSNAVIYSNLYSYGVVRLVANSEARQFYERSHRGTRAINIDHQRRYLMTPLHTPDRHYSDIYLDGLLTNLEMRHNRSDRWQSLKIALKKLQQFKDAELQEDGLLE